MTTTDHDAALRVHAAGVAGRRAWTAWDRVTLEKQHGMLVLASDTPHTRFNAVLQTDPEDAMSLEERFAFIAKAADDRGVPTAWWVDKDVSETEAPGLPKRLGDAGFGHSASLRAMTADPNAMDTRIKTVRDFSCRRVTTDDELATWASTVAIAYGFDESVTADWLALHKAVGYTGASGWRHHLARSGDDVIGCASAFVEDDNVSVSHVTTLPDYRGASVGTAATIRVLEHAREQGLRSATLYAPVNAADLYQRIGFHGVGTLDVYARPAG
ncbi:MAG: GNAT family N-acetyltransferase [Planctomycetota bacterium]